MAHLHAFAIAALAASQALHLARGQVFEFEDRLIPSARSLQGLYMFYVYSKEDQMDSWKMGDSTIWFHDFKATIADPSVKLSDLVNYRGLQVTVMRYDQFWQAISPDEFCSNVGDKAKGLAESPDRLMFKKTPESKDLQVFSHDVGFEPEAKTPPVKLTSSGMYILAFSNCGVFTNATVNGYVAVKNPWGYLPGNEYYKKPFYGTLALLYLAVSIAWAAYMVYWKEQLVRVHWHIAIVSAIGLVETLVFWIYLADWNATGTRRRSLFLGMVSTTVVKTVLSYMLVLATSLGWGFTKEDLESLTVSMLRKIQIFFSLYMVFDYIRETAMSFRYSHYFTPFFSLMVVCPVRVLDGCVMFWIFSAMSALKKELQESRQVLKLALAERVWSSLVFALSVGVITLLFQLAEITRAIEVPWHFQWFMGEGSRHMCFFLVLLVMMLVFRPHAESQRYAFSMQIGAEEDENAPALDSWVDEDGTTAGEGGAKAAEVDYIGSKKGKGNKVNPMPSTIGAQEDSEDDPILGKGEDVKRPQEDLL
mmetsp:Transcript_81116/g.225688  ORF Transcript_81116/g.225688 Transcript_81116/m.225688 type:complete len:534 (+) Transcript_81116:119-1720(+)